MKLGSHNTFTYLPVKQWYLKPFAFMAKCQDLDIWQQYAAGTRWFDFRIYFDKKDIPVFKHGIFKYEHSKEFVYDVLAKLNKCKGIYIRVSLETSESKSKEYKRQLSLFIQFCKSIENTYTNIKFFGGTDRSGFYTGNILYAFKNNAPLMHSKYSSVTSLFESKSTLLQIIDDWYPRYYAKKFNRLNIEEFKTCSLSKKYWFIMDFIGIYN